MQGKKKEQGNDAVVKIDKELLDKIEEFINKKENKLKYVNKKQFVSMAVFNLLEKERKEVRNG